MLRYSKYYFICLIIKSWGWHLLKRILCKEVDWSGDWRLATSWGSAIEERRLKASHPVIAPP